MRTAKAAHADAVHPGYGYLSENADFADAVRAADIVFVGPDRLALSTLGDKRAAKEYLGREAPDVPLIPGFAGSSQDIGDLTAAAEEIGYPVLVKASAGGGGKGLRVAKSASELKDALERAQSEAKRSFGSSDCILEKWIDAGKHVEVQVVGDKHGYVACFWERDCSVQRRNQKIIEETPCPWLTPDLRESMKASALSIANLLQYQGAGTIEFIVDLRTGNHYFLEVNARLQVEHPITEEVTGFDLVALQLYAAAGGRLKDLPPIHDIQQRGHAIECRLCAEVPENDFVPESGPIYDWTPAVDAGNDTRFETAIASKSEVSIYFDPMIAKIIVWAPSRSLAIESMIKVLRNTSCIGVRTNQLFMQSCLIHPAFHEPSYTTDFIPSHLDELLVNPYVKQETRVCKAIPVLPIIYLEQVMKRGQLEKRQPRPALEHLPVSFRNRHSDIGSIGVRVVTAVDGCPPEVLSTAVVIERHAQRNRVPQFRRFAFGALPEVDKESLATDASSKSRAYAMLTYNTLSNQIRSNAFEEWSTSTVSDINLGLAARDSHRGENMLHSFEMRIDGLRLQARVVSPTKDRGPEAANVLCHLPALGTWMSFRCDSLLEFFIRSHALSGTLDDSDAETGSEIKAPMPCKVISVLKSNGDQVKAGEALIVIESMKMETNVCAPKDGTFEALVKADQAVDKGELLCNVA